MILSNKNRISEGKTRVCASPLLLYPGFSIKRAPLPDHLPQARLLGFAGTPLAFTRFQNLFYRKRPSFLVSQKFAPDNPTRCSIDKFKFIMEVDEK